MLQFLLLFHTLLNSLHSCLFFCSGHAFFSLHFGAFVCLFRYFSMCLHEGDKVFNPLHAERFRSLFSKSYFFCSTAFFFATVAVVDVVAGHCRVFTLLLHQFRCLFVCFLLYSAFCNRKTVIGKVYPFAVYNKHIHTVELMSACET